MILNKVILSVQMEQNLVDSTLQILKAKLSLYVDLE